MRFHTPRYYLINTEVTMVNNGSEEARMQESMRAWRDEYDRGEEGRLRAEIARQAAEIEKLRDLLGQAEARIATDGREIEMLRAELEGIVNHMDRNGMGDWPVAKCAKAVLRASQQKKPNA